MIHERPNPEDIEDDNRFDGWLERYEKDLREKSYAMKRQASKHA